jgi:hypothetical protein
MTVSSLQVSSRSTLVEPLSTSLSS